MYKIHLLLCLSGIEVLHIRLRDRGVPATHPTHDMDVSTPAAGPMIHTVTVGGDAGLMYTLSEIRARLGISCTTSFTSKVTPSLNPPSISHATGWRLARTLGLCQIQLTPLCLLQSGYIP